MAKLLPYNDYSRSEVHEIFAPDTDFTRQAGTWGLQGIVQIPGRDGDFVFFVTFGQRQANHIFEEGVTTEGVLTWQSQPKQRLSDRQIQQFINHNEDVNSIYLFLRTSRTKPKYTYLGKLKYLRHDKEREQPVYFQWQILDWNIPESVLRDMSLTLEVVSPMPPPIISTNGPGLEKTTPPKIAPTGVGTPLETKLFRARKVDYVRESARDKRIGRAGELLVLDYERQELRNTGIPELAEKVRHVAEVGETEPVTTLNHMIQTERENILRLRPQLVTKAASSTSPQMSCNFRDNIQTSSTFTVSITTTSKLIVQSSLW